MFGSYSEAINILIGIHKQHFEAGREDKAAAVAQCIVTLQEAWDAEEKAFSKSCEQE